MNSIAILLLGIALLSVALLLFYLSVRKKNRSYSTEVTVYDATSLIDLPSKPTLVLHFQEGLGEISNERFHDMIIELDKVVKDNIVEAVETGKIEYTWESDKPNLDTEPEIFEIPIEEQIIMLKNTDDVGMMEIE